MRKLKTPEEIIKDAGYDKLFWNEIAYHKLIIAAQRDALECAAENVKCEVIEVPGAGSFMHRVVKSSILNHLPKDK